MFLKKQLETWDRKTNEQFKRNRDEITRLSDEVSVTLAMNNADSNFSFLTHLQDLVKNTVNYIWAVSNRSDQERLLFSFRKHVVLLFTHVFKKYDVKDIYYPVTICASIFWMIDWNKIHPSHILADEKYFSPEKREEIYGYSLHILSQTWRDARNYSDLYKNNKSILPDAVLQQHKDLHKQRIKEAIHVTFAKSDSLESATYASLQWNVWTITSLWLLDKQEFIETIATETKAYLTRKTREISEQIKKASWVSDVKHGIERYFKLLGEQSTNWKSIEEWISAGKQLFYKSTDQLKIPDIQEVVTRILANWNESLSWLSDASIERFFVGSKIYTKEQWQKICNDYKQFLEEKKKK
jgi:hypothetical protein